MEFFYAHSIYFMLLLAAVINTIWLIRTRDRLSMAAWAAPLFALLFVTYAVVSTKVFAVAEYGFDFRYFSYMSLFGGVFLLPVALFLGAKISRRSVAEVFDIFAIPTVITVLFARINCLIAGCCLGTFIPGSAVRWPTREVEVIFYAAYLLYFIPRVFHRKTHGEAYPAYMLSYGILRFGLEFLRVTDRTESLFHLSHIWALIAALIGLGFILYLRARGQTNQRKRHA